MSKTRTVLFVIGWFISLYVSYAVGYSMPTANNTHNNPPVPTQAAKSPDVETLWIDANQERGKANLPGLVLDPSLMASATAKCADMVKNNYWGHESPSGKTPQDFITEYSPGWHESGENLSSGYDTSDSVVKAWMASPGHKANILDVDFKRVGYAVCTNDKKEVMVVQHFVQLRTEQ
jgi:uncharacterized protein YkwD